MVVACGGRGAVEVGEGMRVVSIASVNRIVSFLEAPTVTKGHRASQAVDRASSKGPVSVNHNSSYRLGSLP